LVLVAVSCLALWLYAREQFIVALVLACAYVNALFLPEPLRAIRLRDRTGIVIATGMLVANATLVVVLDFALMIPFLTWLPAIAGVLAAKLIGRSG
jgi:hypothetical protein